MTDAQVRRAERAYRNAQRHLSEARDRRDAAVRQAHAEGRTLAELANVLGVTRSMVHLIVQRGT